MNRSIVSVEAIESPFSDQELVEYEDFAMFYSTEFVQTIGQRMIFILILVTLIVVTLGFIALPATGQAISDNQAVSPDC